MQITKQKVDQMVKLLDGHGNIMAAAAQRYNKDPCLDRVRHSFFEKDEMWNVMVDLRWRRIFDLMVELLNLNPADAVGISRIQSAVRENIEFLNTPNTIQNLEKRKEQKP